MFLVFSNNNKGYIYNSYFHNISTIDREVFMVNQSTQAMNLILNS